MDDDLRVVLQVTSHADKQLKKEKITSKELDLIKNNCIYFFEILSYNFTEDYVQ